MVEPKKNCRIFLCLQSYLSAPGNCGSANKLSHRTVYKEVRKEDIDKAGADGAWSWALAPQGSELGEAEQVGKTLTSHLLVFLVFFFLMHLKFPDTHLQI